MHLPGREQQIQYRFSAAIGISLLLACLAGALNVRMAPSGWPLDESGRVSLIGLLGRELVVPCMDWPLGPTLFYVIFFVWFLPWSYFGVLLYGRKNGHNWLLFCVVLTISASATMPVILLNRSLCPQM